MTSEKQITEFWHIKDSSKMSIFQSKIIIISFLKKSIQSVQIVQKTAKGGKAKK